MENESQNFERQFADITDFKNFKFKPNEISLDNQYFNIYNIRLHKLRTVLKQKAIQKWGQRKFLSISGVSQSSSNELVVLIGTIYKNQRLKLSILTKQSEEFQLPLQPLSRLSFVSETNNMFLEDERLRIKLIGDIGYDDKITGIVCAVLGHGQNNNTFWVEDFCLPGMCPKPGISSIPLLSQDKTHIFILSGLDLINKVDIHYQLVVEWLNGMIGNSSVKKQVSSIILVIIAGNSIRGSSTIPLPNRYVEARNENSARALKTKKATHRFDDMLSQIVDSCCVLLMPGEYDPTNHALPQQPLHPSMLPKSSKYKSLYLGTNPWVGKIGNKIIAGSCGQPIEDIIKVSNMSKQSPLSWLEKTLTWRHFAPTAPNNLTTYPYADKDPFIMQECPDIYFVGNMTDYQSKITIGEDDQAVRLISIPKFSTTHTGVLVELESLNSWPISFEAS